MPKRLLSLVATALLLVYPALLRGEENAAPRPVSIQELSLLLRSGYTGDEVLRETAGRPLLAPIDAAAERALLAAGADARTVAALRDGRRVASATEATDAQQRQAATEQHKLETWETDQARRAEANRQAVQAKFAAHREEELRRVATSLQGQLVVWAAGRIEPYKEATLPSKKVFLFYATSGQDKASRQLTPQLAEFYKKFAPAHPEFEMVWLSTDRSEADMGRTLQTWTMPWPALAWESIPKQPDIAALGKEGVPRLVLIDGSGRKLADNLQDGKLYEPGHVIDVLTGKDKPGAPTAAR